MLRRLKTDVEFSLPPKKEVLVYAPLTLFQVRHIHYTQAVHKYEMVGIEFCISFWWHGSFHECLFIASYLHVLDLAIMIRVHGK